MSDQPAENQVAVVPHKDVNPKVQKLKDQAAEAVMLQQMGAKVMRIKAKALKALGAQVQELGIRSIGHGRFVVAAEQAEQAFVRCGEIVDKLIAGQEKGIDPKVIDLIHLQSAFNKQLIIVAKEELESDRLPEAKPEKDGFAMAFPAGQQMAVLINTPNKSTS